MYLLAFAGIFIALGACSFANWESLNDSVYARLEQRRVEGGSLFELQYDIHQPLAELESELSWQFVTHGADPVNVCGEFIESAFFVGSLETNFNITVENNYLGVMRCLQSVRINEWSDTPRAYYFLALSYRSEWYDEDLWMRNWLVATCLLYERAIYAAGNQRLLQDILLNRLPVRPKDPLHLPGVHPRDFEVEAHSIFYDDAVGTIQFFAANGVTLGRLEELVCIHYQSLTRNGVSNILRSLLSSQVSLVFKAKLTGIAAMHGHLEIVKLAHENWGTLPSYMDLQIARINGHYAVDHFVNSVLQRVQ
jgi:hypothetical protein